MQLGFWRAQHERHGSCVASPTTAWWRGCCDTRCITRCICFATSTLASLASGGRSNTSNSAYTSTSTLACLAGAWRIADAIITSDPAAAATAAATSMAAASCEAAAHQLAIEQRPPSYWSKQR